MIRIDSISVRLGIAGDEVGELGEEVAGVVGAGAGLGVVLHAEGGDVTAAETFHDTVVEVHMGDVGRGNRALGDRVVVVLAGDFDGPRGQAANRVVPAVVPELELV